MPKNLTSLWVMVSIATALISLGVSWGFWRARFLELYKRMGSTNVIALEERVNVLEKENKQISKDLATLKNDVRWIRNWLENGGSKKLKSQ